VVKIQSNKPHFVNYIHKLLLDLRNSSCSILVIIMCVENILCNFNANYTYFIKLKPSTFSS